MLKLNRSNSYFFINGDITPELYESIDSVTSYYVNNYEKTDAFQTGKWDGKEHLLRRSKNGSYYFPFGLIDKVCQILRIWNIKYVIVDAVCSINPIPDDCHAESISLRQYQRDAINKLITNCYNCSGILSLPTGAGKTQCALFYAWYLKLPFVVLVHRVELLRQWNEEIKDKLGISPTLIGAGEDYAGNPDVIVAMVQTISKRELKLDTGLLIIDECHITPAKLAYSVSMNINAKYRLGLSATPKRQDGAELKIFSCCGCIADVISVDKLVELYYLAVPQFNLVRLSPCNIPNNSTWNEAYTRGIVNNIERNIRIAEISNEYISRGRCIYIHVSRIDHGKILAGMIPGSVFIHGGTNKEDRKETIEKYRNGDITCLISTLLKEGVSIDGISCLIYAAGGKSEVSLIQTIGRALRKDAVFGDAILIDFIDHGNRILENHVNERISAYRRTYGELFPY